MKILLLILIMLIPIVHYDDEDGHREPWAEWREASCISEPVITYDSSYYDPPCNPYTNKGITGWACLTGGSVPLHEWISFYTTHWYCGVIGEGLQRHHVFLSVVAR